MSIVSLSDYEEQAHALLQPAHYDYFAGGAENEVTLRENTKAFDHIKLRPKVLQGQTDSNLQTKLLGIPINTPIIIAPTAFHCLANPDGECATAKATLDANTIMMVSMASTIALEEITSIANKKQANRFQFQLYIQPDREYTLELVQRAETAGCSALIVTVDSPTFGQRFRDIKNQFFDLPDGLHCANLKTQGDNEYRPIEFDSTLNWGDIDWLCSNTKLPVILKGILHPQDAQLAIEHGASAIMVSNHGGRQLDGVAATIELLPDIAEANKQTLPIIFDGGIRRGTDILKALALGATTVAIGRPVLWGLTVSGSKGVTGVLNFLKQDLLNAMQLAGCKSLADINNEVIFNN